MVCGGGVTVGGTVTMRGGDGVRMWRCDGVPL